MTNPILAEVITARCGSTVDIVFKILGPMMGQVNAKAVRALAVMSDKRAAKLPDVPTLREEGINNAQASSWNALAVPAKTSKDVIARLNSYPRCWYLKPSAGARSLPRARPKLKRNNTLFEPSIKRFM